MDFAPPFQMAHSKAFELAEKLVQIAPAGLSKVFYTNSGSVTVDTALKMALTYHRVRGEGSGTRLIGRERGYHGVNFGGIVSNRKMPGTLLAGVDHIRHTHDAARNAFAVGQPEHRAEFADDLECLVALHDAWTIAAVIVEPVAGSFGVTPDLVTAAKGPTTAACRWARSRAGREDQHHSAGSRIAADRRVRASPWTKPLGLPDARRHYRNGKERGVMVTRKMKITSPAPSPPSPSVTPASSSHPPVVENSCSALTSKPPRRPGDDLGLARQGGCLRHHANHRARPQRYAQAVQ